ncbi:hypothetical protein GIB67_015726 [Kingdonia uniflora]|uniref:Uncharacterized protein n=1 Tax=Kingdonia uniflora TaxID=39325 RepID=A0A7J7NUY8_9MAGN|nr:hypothetical protein GIB67_015726 [Kingdonia uniflora]
MGFGGTPSDIRVISLGLAVSVKEGITAQFGYGLTLPLSNLVKRIMNMIGACPAQLNYNFWEVILVCETLNERWAASSSERRITAKNFLAYYAVKYVTATDGAYLSSSSQDHASSTCLQQGECGTTTFYGCLVNVFSGINCKLSRKESFIDAVAKEGTELEAAPKELEISRFKRVASKDNKLARLNKMPDGPVDMATVSCTVVQNLAKRKAVKRGADSHSVTSDSVDDSSKRRMEQCRAKAREKIVAVVDDEFMKLKLEKEREAAALKLKEVRAESVAEAERLVTASATSRNSLAGKLYQLRYTKVEIMAFSEGNYEEKEIMDEEEVEEMEDGLNVVKKTTADNQET